MFINEDERLFWNKQTSSLHRSDVRSFYERKAIEQSGLMTDEEREAPCIDLGCGAGELLEHLRCRVNITTGIDYSESMLKIARKRLAGSGITLENHDLFEYLPSSLERTWITTGAINQYLEPISLKRFLKIFKDNSSARALYLFDCVDPIRYAIYPVGLSYRPVQKIESNSLRSILRNIIFYFRRGLVCIKLGVGLFGRSGSRLGKAGMGYGYAPSEWRSFLESLNLECEIVSSQFYEYRFHIIIRK